MNNKPNYNNIENYSESKAVQSEYIAEKFRLQGNVQSVVPIGNGHINDTYLVTCIDRSSNTGIKPDEDSAIVGRFAGTTRRYVLQRINSKVFKSPEKVMHNMVVVTEHLRRAIKEEQKEDTRNNDKQYATDRPEDAETEASRVKVRQSAGCRETLTLIPIKETIDQSETGDILSSSCKKTVADSLTKTNNEKASSSGKRISIISVSAGIETMVMFYRCGDDYWRMTEYIEGTHSCEHLSGTAGCTNGPTACDTSCDPPARVTGDGKYLNVDNANDGMHGEADGCSVFREIGAGYGRFLSRLSDLDAGLLYETIEHFHDARKRFDDLMAAYSRAAGFDAGGSGMSGHAAGLFDDSSGASGHAAGFDAGGSGTAGHEGLASRASRVTAEMDFASNREHLVDLLNDKVASGELPLRVTHNDTKINNVLIDDATGRAICVIDLDTVMPGLVINDFADAIRSGASTGREDEKDPGKISLDIDLFAAFAEGFLREYRCLSQLELELIPDACILMALECGMRFLTDYLEGDVYFKTDYEGQNLDRCRAQFRLAADMESKRSEMLLTVKNKIASDCF